MPRRWKYVAGFALVFGLVVGTLRVNAQDVATPQPLTGATPEATPVVSSIDVGEQQFEAGTILATTENLRLRTEPTTDAEALMTLAEGTELQVIDGPELVEGYIWYEVEVLDTEESVSGWVAVGADFVDPVQEAN